MYYPGSGWDSIPKDTLGVERVVHLSLEEIEGGYFKKLGHGINIVGDFRNSPFCSNVFDATLIYGIPPDAVLEAIPEFRRVTKIGGLIIVATEKICSVGYKYSFNIIYMILEQQIKAIELPKNFGDFKLFTNIDIR